MPSIRKHRNKWQSQVRIKGTPPISKSFDKRSDAVAWSQLMESQIRLGTFQDSKLAEKTIVSDLIQRYADFKRVSSKLDGSVRSRLGRLRRSLGAFSLKSLSAVNISEYRDQRLQVVNPATVAHELSLLIRILKFAETELCIRIPNGMPKVRMPKLPRGRVRRLAVPEEELLIRYSAKDKELRSFIVLAIETGMRRSELCSLDWSDIDLHVQLLHVRKSKNGDSRTIPLSERAIKTLEGEKQKFGPLFRFSSSAVSQRFARLCKKAEIVNLRLHDLRHEAISRLFELGMNQMEVATISGHRSVSMLSRYTHIHPYVLACKLNELEKLKSSRKLHICEH